MPNSSVPVTAGAGTNIDTYLVGADHRQYVIPADHGGFGGRFTTYKTLGRAGATGQNIAAIFNGSGSTVAVDVKFVGVDLIQTVVKAVTIEPPIIRLLKLTTLPTNGTAGFKVAEDSAVASNASVTTFQDASSETASSGTALAFTAGQLTAANGVTQEFAPRLMAIGTTPATNLYEMSDRVEFLLGGGITLRANEGLGVRLEYTNAASNPTTDKWIVTMRWEEYTP